MEKLAKVYVCAQDQVTPFIAGGLIIEADLAAIFCILLKYKRRSLL